MRVMARIDEGHVVTSDVVHLKKLCVIKGVIFHYLLQFSQSLQSIIWLLISHVQGAHSYGGTDVFVHNVLKNSFLNLYFSTQCTILVPNYIPIQLRHQLSYVGT